MTEMSYTTLGASGLVVSRLALGTMTFTKGSDWIPGVATTGPEDAQRMVDMAMPATVWVCSTHLASGRAAWMAEWMTKPAGLIT